MPNHSLQDQIFDLILKRYSRRSDAVEDLCQVLNASRDSVYRRIRGDTDLSPSELALLSNRYGFSIDAMLQAENHHVVCRFNAFSRQVRSFDDYLEAFDHDLQQARRLPNVYLYYTSVEIPVFSYHFFPELLAFKLYVWGRTTWNFDYLRNRPFDLSLMSAPTVRLSDQVLDHYLAIPSSELWSVQVTDNTLAQIEYHVISGGFQNPEDGVLLCDRLLEWTVHMKSMAIAGRKFRPGEKPIDSHAAWDLYHNEMVYTNITALLTSDLGRQVYAAFCNPNFLESRDPELCAYVENWFNAVLSKSYPISQTSEKNREWFFQELDKKIHRVRKRISVYLETIASE